MGSYDKIGSKLHIGFYMTQTSNLYLVRHGQTDWNLENRIQGHNELPLNEIGKEQSEKVSLELTHLNAAAIYSSPMLRAKQMAEIIAKGSPCEIVIEENLIEGKFGSIEGMTKAEFKEKFQEDLINLHRMDADTRLRHKLVPDADSILEIAERTIPCLKGIAAKHPDQNVIIVTHGWLMRSLLVVLNQNDDRSTYVSNGGIIKLKGSPDELTVEALRGVENHSWI